MLTPFPCTPLDINLILHDLSQQMKEYQGADKSLARP